jgi:hypothetical protein
MSEEMVSFTPQYHDIYVPLLNEGTDVIRPTRGRPLGEMKYEVLPVPGYSPSLEEWQFPPGTIVKCVLEKHGGREVLVARSWEEKEGK